MNSTELIWDQNIYQSQEKRVRGVDRIKFENEIVFSGHL